MKSKVEGLPVAHEALGEMFRMEDWGGTSSAYIELPTGLDFGPMLEEAIKMVEFSPCDQQSQVMAHVVGKL